jgi:hypothetical protein
VIFQRIEAERMVVFLDACYSGTAGGRTFTSLKARSRAAHVDDLFLERLARSRDCVERRISAGTGWSRSRSSTSTWSSR